MVRLVTFDVFMALVDIKGSLVPKVSGVLGLNKLKACEFVQTWRQKQMECAAVSNSLGHGRTPFRRCTELALDYTLAHFKVPVTTSQHCKLVMSWDTLTPWPEACQVVAEIRRRGYKTAILSNGDSDTLNALAKPFGDNMQHILSAEMAGAYKPHPEVYNLPEQKLRILKADVLHVAGSGTDVIGAGSFGIDCYWANRDCNKLLDPTFAPKNEGPDLRGVLELL